ncbi:hypothetical protein UXP55_06380 [Enterobacter hormaechei]|uniref:hypothetical protein n=1 Tax=Enterobacter cloacae complex TaxID=354276 RepID=UPI000BB8E0F1|nr:MULTISPECIES: hypothetical protein [Enterobacter cloacae complex]HAV1964606.1 hypothetical protein [Enterobacter hormaechei subsp. xiangfangensis]HDT6029671.1 hypothetical protein [Enterobacter cloacae subsp. cloacae]MDV5366307.1 hypothetical protein [Enterobacter hormaechei]MRF03743.1 hypothetical protein [Enterobacter hormaechei]HDT6095763.1 hypothetical protein [Enterobacter cloacae subsp. cloacae]
MNDVGLYEKNESMFFAICTTLSLYCDFIYEIAYGFHNEAVMIIENEKCVGQALQIQINNLFDDFDYYKKMNGTGKEKREDIDEKELFNKVMAAHNQGVKVIIMKNLEANLRASVDGPEYWKLKIIKQPI